MTKPTLHTGSATTSFGGHGLPQQLLKKPAPVRKPTTSFGGHGLPQLLLK